MSDFQKDDRVVVKSGKYRNEHGKVVDGKIKVGLWSRKISVKLDKSGHQDILVGDLKYESLGPDEVKAVMKNVLNQVKKVASELPGEMKTELPTHIGYLDKAIASKDTFTSEYELNYVMKNLEKASKVESVKEQLRETRGIDMEKISWVVKRLSRQLILKLQSILLIFVAFIIRVMGLFSVNLHVAVGRAQKKRSAIERDRTP